MAVCRAYGPREWPTPHLLTSGWIFGNGNNFNDASHLQMMLAAPGGAVEVIFSDLFRREFLDHLVARFDISGLYAQGWYGEAVGNGVDVANA